jgi:hypothetical protein
VFEAGGSAVDHAHDALMLALLAITQNYGSLHKMNFAVKAESFSNTFFMPKPISSDDEDGEKSAVINRSNLNNGSISNKRKSIRRSNNGSVSRKMF